MEHNHYQSTPEELADLEQKLQRLRNQQSLRVVDLFAGCGGMSLGLQRSGYQLLGGVEINSKAIDTHANNFFGYLPENELAIHKIPRDIKTFTPEIFMREVLHAEQPANLVDVIVGGPPCQAFSRIGRAKLQQLRQEKNAYLSDERSNLYIPYLQYVEFFRPLAVIMENVPDIMNYGGKNVAEVIAETLEEIGYHCHYTVLNTAFYGVPQLRQRFYMVALLDDLNITPCFPDPTHFIELSVGYEHAHASARSTIADTTQQLNLFGEVATRYIEPPRPSKNLPSAITAREALSDLPPITYHLQKGSGRGFVRRFDTMTPYQGEASVYAQNMRMWPGFESNEGIWDHVIRLLPRDYEIFKRMNWGGQYPDAYAVAEEIFYKELYKREKLTGPLDQDSEEYQNLRKQFVPPYDPNKFPNKWWKLIPDQPSRTLTAHMGRDTYSHIHYDSNQARVISVREAARLQSFPDGFKFTGPMGPAYTQIGNAVAPLQAYQFGLHIKELLMKKVEEMYKHLLVTPLNNIQQTEEFLEKTITM